MYIVSKNLVSLCFADRTFSSIRDILKYAKFGWITSFMYKLFLLKNPENVSNYLQVIIYNYEL